VLLGCGAEVVQDHARLDAGDAALGIDFEDARHVLREIKHDRHIAALSGERGASAAGKQRRAMFAAQGNRGENVFGVARDYDSDRNLTVVGTVGRIEGAAAGVKADFAAQMAAEGGFESSGVNGLRTRSEGASRDVALSLG